MKKREEKYMITPKGLLDLALASDQSLWDSIELYCYRHGYNAILVNKDGGKFINVELTKPKRK